MVFEDYYEEFFNGRRSLEDPYRKVTISKDKYKKLMETAEKYEMLVKKMDQIVARKTELEDQIESLKEDGRQLKDLEEKTEKYLNSLLRTQADFDNYKKANQRENERYRARVKEEMLKKLIKHYEDLLRALNVLDLLEKGESVKKGFKMIIENFEKFLEDEGVKPMDSEGEIFDPYKHEALMVEENEELPENTIIEELNKGYFLNNKVLRPAGVKISKTKSNL
ncbi:MAG: nucleotide exchange factor GrpE [Candidatus Lokiarchaeota archaeon]|nr:nucleotide exchange factor GrpE [Candidatus Lokiarchaeota archaeon]